MAQGDPLSTKTKRTDRRPRETPLPDIGKASDANKTLSIVNLDLLEQEASQILSPQRMAFTGPAGDGWTYDENRRAFNDFAILPRRMRGVAKDAVDTRVRLLGTDLAVPIITAPVGAQGFFHVDAEVPNACGTHMAGSLFVESSASTKSIEEIARAAAGPKWFQIYMNKDMGINRDLCLRAKNAGFSAIVLTCDAMGPGQSDESMRLGLPSASQYYQPGNYDPARGGRGDIANEKALTFSDIDFLREVSGLPLVVKSVLSRDDIEKSIEHGAAAIWVSNHGGRQTDGVVASISRLSAALRAVRGRVPVIVDGGIRRGKDVFKALALGANAVAVGRPILWGLTAGGAEGVKSVYDFLSLELRNTMCLSGVGTVAEMDRRFIRKATGSWR